MEQRILVPLDGTEVGEAVLPKLEDLVLKDSTYNGCPDNPVESHLQDELQHAH